jgi:signal transduction histidine kinase
MFSFSFDLDPAVPTVPVNEFIIWEILEPLIQNSIDHGRKVPLVICLSTHYDQSAKVTTVRVVDNGIGIDERLLQVNGKGIKNVFAEKDESDETISAHSGYGCYIAHQMAVGKCGWELDAENLPEGGCSFTIKIQHKDYQ